MEFDFYGFYTGQAFSAYNYLGGHLTEEGAVFRTFAPNAKKISLIGEWNEWQEIPMEQVYDGNFWECAVSGAAQGMAYKYRIIGKDGRCIDHCDPYGFFAEVRPNTASILWGLSNFSFTDSAYRGKLAPTWDQPVNIYEMHAGSWKKPREGGFFTYRELADKLIPYLLKNHYSHVELMPLAEHPFDGSWGYQATGFFSPTSRYGDPDGLRYFVNACHLAGIGVLLDFVPVHFAVNDYALWHYDGSALYEYPHSDVGINQWGSYNFIHSRGEVRSFLQSSAAYWLKEFHFDGLRVDAVRNLLYWQGDETRGENREGIRFLKGMNAGLKERFPHVLLIAEDSSTYPGVTAPVEQGGLGFDYKWDLGWMNDTLSYLQSPLEERRVQRHKLTFSMDYFYHEKYLLPLSHDEVVHGKASILQKMQGDNYQEKFAQARLLYLFMFAHPGKKLNFMGNELGMFQEWDENRELDWNLLAYPQHQAFARFCQDLNSLYETCPPLFGSDYTKEGFSWLEGADLPSTVFAFIRRHQGQILLVICNYDKERLSCPSLKLPNGKKASLLLNTD